MRIDDSSIRVNRTACIACGICVDLCIMDNLRLSVAPCRQVCPVGMNCQGYIRLLALDKEDQALEQLLPFGPFLPIIADTCTAPCEKVCTRGKKDGAVHILELKRYLSKKYLKEFNTISVRGGLSGNRMAIIGIGIGGLACAFRALQSGHHVNLFPGASGGSSHPAALGLVRTALEKAGAVFLKEKEAADRLAEPEPFDAVILSRPEDRLLFPAGYINTIPDGKIDPVSHLIQDHIFCVDTGISAKGPVYEIAEAFETIESVNRFFNREPFSWGRGFYTQAGAVKEYRADIRVGSDELRASEQELAQGFDKEIAKKQASRCFGCGRAFEKNQTCWYCLPCELECPRGALEVRIPYLVR